MSDFLNSRKTAAGATQAIPTAQCCCGEGSETHASAMESSRRHFFQMALRGTLAGLVTATGIEFASPRPLLAQSNITPDAALKELMDGNTRFRTGRGTAHEQDIAILKQNTLDKQEPYAAVLACADSRVPVEMIFDQSIGHVFVTRVAGNMVTP